MVILKRKGGFFVIEPNSIPNLDLYMDQVITLFEEKLKDTKRHKEDKLLTKTMVNNYTKNKLIMPAIKKKYSKNHVLLLALLCELKPILSLEDIKTLFDTLRCEGEIDSQLLIEVYKTIAEFKKVEEDTIHQKVKEIEKKVKGLDYDEKIKRMIQVILLTEKANSYKKLAEKMIDEDILAIHS